jgi:NAD dependent epimerase/dehydratase family enzyme
MFGTQLADELFLNGIKILPTKSENHGFKFLYPTIDNAWNEIVNVETKS